MSVRQIQLAWKAQVGGIRKLVLVAMADYADDDGGSVFPSVPTLAEKCGIGETTCRGALRSLEKAGRITVTEEATQHRPRTYRLLLGTSRAADPAPLSEHSEPRAAGSAVRAAGSAVQGGRSCPQSVIEPSENQRQKGGRSAAAPRPSHAELLETFNDLWEVMPRALCYGDAKKQAWEMWRARALGYEQVWWLADADWLVAELAETVDQQWQDVRVFDAPGALAVCWQALDAGVSVAEALAALAADGLDRAGKPDQAAR